MYVTGLPGISKVVVCGCDPPNDHEQDPNDSTAF